MPDPEIIAKGAYVFTQNDALLPLKEFVFFTENGKKYLLLKWENRRGEILCGLRFTLFFRDAAGDELGKEVHSFENLNVGANAAFLLPKIEVPQDCVDFRADLRTSRYGHYLYRCREGEAVAEYAPCARQDGAGAPAKKENAKDFDVRVRRPAYPVWIAVFFCAMLAVLILFTCLRLKDFKTYSDSFLKDGVEYTFVNRYSEDCELYVTGYHGERKHLTIPESVGGYPVAEIYSYAFRDNNYVETIDLQGGLVIGAKAFTNCGYLQSINLEKVTVIRSNAFENCYRLTDVTAFELTRLEDNAFYNCSMLDTVVIQNDEKTLEIGNSPFYGCGDLSLVAIDQNFRCVYAQSLFSGIYRIGTLQLKTFPAEWSGLTLSSLFGDYGHSYDVEELIIGSMPTVPAGFCSELSVRRVEIGEIENSVIGERAFENCSGLRIAQLPPVREIGACAFTNTPLEKFDFSAAETIGESAFYGCNFSSLELPSKVQYIGNGAFSEVYGLSEIYLPFLGTSRDSQGTIGDVFGFSSNLQTITLTEPVEMLNEYAFSGCTNLIRVNLPDSIVSIGAGAFQGCEKLTSFNLPPNLVSIGAYAFAGCISLNRITLPATLKSIGADAFAQCYRLYEVKNESGVNLALPPAATGRLTEYALKIYGAGEDFAERTEADGYSFASFDGVWYLVEYPKYSDVLELPASCGDITGYDVADYLFAYDRRVSRVVIPPAVQKLGKYAFTQCDNLKTVTFDKGSPLTELAEGVFNNCRNLYDIRLPENLARIGNYALRSSALSSVILPETLNYIGEQAFQDCGRLKTVYNLSALRLVKGSQTFGYVAFYAEDIFKSLDENTERMYAET